MCTATYTSAHFLLVALLCFVQIAVVSLPTIVYQCIYAGKRCKPTPYLPCKCAMMSEVADQVLSSQHVCTFKLFTVVEQTSQQPQWAPIASNPTRCSKTTMRHHRRKQPLQARLATLMHRCRHSSNHSLVMMMESSKSWCHVPFVVTASSGDRLLRLLVAIASILNILLSIPNCLVCVCVCAVHCRSQLFGQSYRCTRACLQQASEGRSKTSGNCEQESESTVSTRTAPFCS